MQVAITAQVSVVATGLMFTRISISKCMVLNLIKNYFYQQCIFKKKKSFIPFLFKNKKNQRPSDKDVTAHNLPIVHT